MDFYSKYIQLQEVFNDSAEYAETNADLEKILKDIFGDEKEMKIVARLLKTFKEGDRAIEIIPIYIINNDMAIPYILKNGKKHNRIYTELKKNDDNENIKTLTTDILFECEIQLLKEKVRQRFNTYFRIKIETIKSYNELNLKELKIIKRNCCCTLYKLFDKKDKNNDLKEWSYEDFLCLVKDDVTENLLLGAREAFNEKNSKLETELDEKRKTIEDINKNLETISGQIEKREDELKALNQNIYEKRRLLKSFWIDTDLNVLETKKQEKQDNSNTIEVASNEIIESIKTALETCNENVKLVYSRSVIRQMFAGICTNQLIVLIGDPGSGKTSLALNLSKCLKNGGKTKIIPVQPGWMDKTDLLGYYNPIEKCYVPTEFLDTLIDFCELAKENPDKIYFICLDEMNLSQIEYYFSDFLSKLQTDRIITLYSQGIYEEMKNDYSLAAAQFMLHHEGDIKDIATFKSRQELEEYLKLKHTKKALTRYKNEIMIPENVKFIGTLNQDETTKDLSPKVLDRSLVIKLQSNVQKRIMLNESIMLEDTAINSVDWNEDVEIKWKHLVSEFAKCNIRISNRLETTAKVLANVLPDIDLLFDTVISTMILPKINCSPYQNDIDNLKTTLSSFCDIENRPSSRFIYQDMLERCKTDQDILTFWSK